MMYIRRGNFTPSIKCFRNGQKRWVLASEVFYPGKFYRRWTGSRAAWTQIITHEESECKARTQPLSHYAGSNWDLFVFYLFSFLFTEALYCWMQCKLSIHYLKCEGDEEGRGWRRERQGGRESNIIFSESYLGTIEYDKNKNKNYRKRTVLFCYKNCDIQTIFNTWNFEKSFMCRKYLKEKNLVYEFSVYEFKAYDYGSGYSALHV